VNVKHCVGCEEVEKVELYLDRKAIQELSFGFPKAVKGCDN